MSTWLAPNRTSTIVQLPAGTEWYILNPRQIGYFRVNYDAAGWQSLRSLLDSDDFGRLPAAARSALLDDAFNLARAGYEGYDLALDLARYLPQEVEYQPWVAACRAFDFLDRKLRDRSSVQRAFRVSGCLINVFLDNYTSDRKKLCCNPNTYYYYLVGKYLHLIHIW